MTQLELFPRPFTRALRDKSKDRRWSPEKDEFRRDHARRRNWGLKRRHAEKLCRLRGCTRQCMELGIHDPVEPIPPLIWDAEATCTQRPPRQARSSAAPAGSDPERGSDPRDGLSDLPTRAETEARAEGPGRPADVVQAAKTSHTVMAEDSESPQTERANRAEGAVRTEPAAETEDTVGANGVVEAEEMAGPAGFAGSRVRMNAIFKMRKQGRRSTRRAFITVLSAAPPSPTG
jgi:hypothetical protein